MATYKKFERVLFGLQVIAVALVIGIILELLWQPAGR